MYNAGRCQRAFSNIGENDGAYAGYVYVACAVMNFAKIDRDRRNAASASLTVDPVRRSLLRRDPIREEGGGIGVAGSVLIRSLLTDESDRGRDVREGWPVKYTVYHEIAVDLPRECSFNPLAIPRDILRSIVFHFRENATRACAVNLELSPRFIFASPSMSP